MSVDNKDVKAVTPPKGPANRQLTKQQVQQAQSQIASARPKVTLARAKQSYKESITEYLVQNYNSSKNNSSMDSRTECLYILTDEYLQTINPDSPPSPRDIQNSILAKVTGVFDAIGTAKGQGNKWKKPDGLEPFMIAQIIVYLYHVVAIASAGLSGESEYDLLGIYQFAGPDEGIYVTSDEIFRVLIREFNRGITLRQIDECKTIIKDSVPRVERTNDKNLIAVANGVFDYDTKKLLPFTPEYVFTTKCPIPYNPNATNVFIKQTDGTTWDVVSWFNSLSDSPAVVHTLKQIVGAVIRPNVPWNISAWFYSEQGNNGKGTLCELMRQIVGEKNCVSITLTQMGQDFQLEPLLHATAIVTDENDVGTFLDKAANLKAIITQDPIQINRKFKQPIAYKFHGFMVQCLNEMPRIKDKSDSFFRRQLFVPFTKCFTGHENKKIKKEYLHRKDVLEFVVKEILESDYYTIDIPDECKLAQKEYRDYNDPVRQFADEMFQKLAWDFVPMTFLYDLFKAWYGAAYPGQKAEAYPTFTKDVGNILKDYPEWNMIDSNHRRIVHAGEMAAPEPMIDEYELKAWLNPRYKTAVDRTKACTPAVNPNTKYAGLERVAGASASGGNN